MAEAGRLPRGSGRTALQRAWHGFIRHRGIDSAAALTFFTALSTLPALLVLVSAFALVDDRRRASEDLAAIVATVLPEDATADVERGLRELLSLDNPGIALTIGILLLLWTVSGYATAFGRAMNSVYEVEEGRPFWAFRGRMLLVSAGLVVLQTLIVGILLLTPSATADILGRRDIGMVVATVWDIGKWPVLLGLAVLFVAVLYYFTPNVRHTRVRWASAGSLGAIAIWLVATLGFALYLLVAGHYDLLYGSLGGLVTALLWGYLTNAALVAGAELDAEFVRLRQLARGEPAEELVRLPLRDSRRNRMLARQRTADVEASRSIRKRVENGD
ncbi:MAG TPA: YihY/virulence factor BrkB family protein [Pseudolysinimonas sp.]|nr:YihY/virulence factor BrkB family protein [Pseudolysinimonas sp.]